MKTLELGLIGNGSISALIDENAEIVWSCLPRFDGDPVFCSLLQAKQGEDSFGLFGIEVQNFSHAEQHYLDNTAILVTHLHDTDGGCVEVSDFAPRFKRHGRMFHPMMLVRKIRRVSGSPRIRLRLRPAGDYGKARPELTHGSNHIRYVLPGLVLRATTDVPIVMLLQELPFFLEDSLTLLLGPDESVPEAPSLLGHQFLESTRDYWREWVRNLAIPFEWQDVVIRSAITLKLNAYDETGAIIAAMTTSIPEAANSTRNWDYRYCWLRDGYFVVNALNRLGATQTMERYLSYIVNIAAGNEDDILQPVYGIDGRRELHEMDEPALAGYRGMGPVRRGNLAYVQVQHDVYGSAILAATHVFFDRRLIRHGDATLFQHLEALGEKAVRNYNQPDAGLWELRGKARVHTFSAVMCWAACDRLALIAAQLKLDARARYWRTRSEHIRKDVIKQAWHPQRNSFVSSFGGEDLDASLLLLADLGFISADDPRFATTVDAIGRELKHGDFIFRYIEKDDFGTPENAFLVCSFWYVNALVALGRRDEARALFEKLLACRNRHGLLAEHIDPKTGEQWGNYVQTYSMVGLINAAIRLSVRWDQAF